MTTPTRLHRLHDEQGQSPWLDNLTRPMLRSGDLHALVDAGVRGVTSNPTIFAKAMCGGTAYDEQFDQLVDIHPVEDAYWAMAIRDVTGALDVLSPVHDASSGHDGFVSLEVSPAIATDTDATVRAACFLHDRIARPNLLVKVPATNAGVASVRTLVAGGRSLNVTLIFGLERYGEVIEAYMSGLEELSGDLSGVAGVASFFVSRVDSEVDRRLGEVGTQEAQSLRGRTAVAQAVLAYQLFRQRFSGPRWDALAARGARVQRPLWASTSTKNPAYPELLYVESLIGPDTVNTMPDATLAAFRDRGTIARTIDADVDGARRTLDRVAAVGIDLDEVSAVLEDQGVGAFAAAFDDLLSALAHKAGARAAS